MAPKSLAVLGLAAAASTGISFASSDIASATSIPKATSATHPAAVASLPVHLAAVHTAAPVHIAATYTVAPTPAAAPAPPAAAPVQRTYTAVKGDCLWSIGQRFGVSMYAMAAANNMRLSDILYVGRVLTVPPPGTTAPAPVVQHVSATPTHSTRTYASRTYTHTAPTVHHSTYHATHYSTSHSSSSSAVSGSATPSSSLESCIIARESGGRSNVWNASGHWGLYQFSRSTWVAYGGSSSSFGSASASQQQQVFRNAIAAGGASNWTPYDGC